MKKLLLLSALLIFACSSDDSSNDDDNSNQTFLERYDGVVWEYVDYVPNTNYGRYNIFYNSDYIFWREVFADPPDPFVECDYEFFGYSEEDELTISIYEHSYNELVIKAQNESGYQFVTFSVDSNEVLTITAPTEDFYGIYFKTTLTDPCD